MSNRKLSITYAISIYAIFVVVILFAYNLLNIVRIGINLVTLIAIIFAATVCLLTFFFYLSPFHLSQSVFSSLGFAVSCTIYLLCVIASANLLWIFKYSIPIFVTFQFIFLGLLLTILFTISVLDRRRSNPVYDSNELSNNKKGRRGGY